MTAALGAMAFAGPAAAITSLDLVGTIHGDSLSLTASGFDAGIYQVKFLTAASILSGSASWDEIYHERTTFNGVVISDSVDGPPGFFIRLPKGHQWNAEGFVHESTPYSCDIYNYCFEESFIGSLSTGMHFAPGSDGLGYHLFIGQVPEPGAWALMILGFTGTGAALRRRRRGGPEPFPSVG